MLTIFGSVAVGLMLLAYWLEPRSKWYVLAFAFASAATGVYSGLEEVYPISVIEGLWTLVAMQRFYRRHRSETPVVVL